MSRVELDAPGLEAPGEEDYVRGPSRARLGWLYLLSDKKALVGLAILALFTVLAIFAPLVAPYDPNAMDYEMIEGPGLPHVLGTDDLGRDLLSRLIYGGRISLFVGVSTVALALLAGVVLGVAAGFYGGWVDSIIMRYIDLQWAFPNFIIAVYLVAVFGTGLSNVIVAISLAFVDDFARIARSMVLTIKQEQYVDAARTLGASNNRIMWRHILPNAMAPLIVQATVLADSRSFISRAWWLGVVPGVAIMLTVLSINFLGDALRDILDVRETKTVA